MDELRIIVGVDTFQAPEVRAAVACALLATLKFHAAYCVPFTAVELETNVKLPDVP